MTEVELLDRAFAEIMAATVRTGVAPHHAELAPVLGVSPSEALAAVTDLFASGVPGWLHPDTDYIASFPPFNNQPTQYRVSIEGEQRWFAQ